MSYRGRNRLLFKAVTAGVAVLVTAAAFAQSVTISDTEFNNSDWTTVVTKTLNGGTVQAYQQTTGGNPGSFRLVIHDMPHQFASITHSQLLTDPTRMYDPSTEGAISSFDFSFDEIVTTATIDGAYYPNGGSGQAFALMQDGKIYYLAGHDLSFQNKTWQTASVTGLTADDFVDLNGSHPDFSTNGKPIAFGVDRTNTHTGSDTRLIIETGLDNFIVLISALAGISEPPTTLAAIRESLGLVNAQNTGLVEQRLHGGTVCGICALIEQYKGTGLLGYGEDTTANVRDALALMHGKGGTTEKPSAIPGWTAFTGGSGLFGHFDGTANQSGLEFDGRSGVVGLDRAIGTNTVVGLSLGYGGVNGTFSGADGSNDAHSTTLSAYASRLLDRFTYVDAVFSQGWASNSQSRTETGGTVSGSTSAQTTSLSLGIGTDRPVPGTKMMVGGSLGLSGSRTAIDGYDETATGTATAFSIPGETVNSLALTAGVRLATIITRPGMTIVPHFSAGISRELLGQGDSLSLTPTGGGSAVTSTIDAPNPTTYSLSGGLNIAVGPSANFNADVATTFGGGSRTTSISVGGHIRF